MNLHELPVSGLDDFVRVALQKSPFPGCPRSVVSERGDHGLMLTLYDTNVKRYYDGFSGAFGLELVYGSPKPASFGGRDTPSIETIECLSFRILPLPRRRSRP
jgi:hypothetical protein